MTCEYVQSLLKLSSVQNFLTMFKSIENSDEEAYKFMRIMAILINGLGECDLKLYQRDFERKLQEYMVESKFMKDFSDPVQVMTQAIEDGKVEVVRHFLDKGYKFPPDACRIPIANGDLPMLQYLREQGCFVSASSFHIDLISENLPILKFLCSHSFRFTTAHLRCATEQSKGNMDIINWMMQIGCSLPLKVSKICNIDVYEWVKERGIAIDMEGVCSSLSEIGDILAIKCILSPKDDEKNVVLTNIANKCGLKEVRELRSFGYKPTSATIAAFVRKDDIEGFMWLLRDDCPVDYECSKFAVMNSNVEILKILHITGKLINYNLINCMGGAGERRRDTIIWMQDMKLIFREDPSICLNLCDIPQNLENLKWAISAGYKMNLVECINYAITRQNKDTVKYLLSIDDLSSCCEDLFVEAFKSPDYDILDLLHFKFRYDVNDVKYFTLSVEHGDITVFEWLKMNGFRFNETTFAMASLKSSDVDEINWLIKNSCSINIPLTLQFVKMNPDKDVVKHIETKFKLVR